MARYIDKEFEINHYHSMLVNPTPDVTSIDKRNAMIILDALEMAKTVDVPDRNVGEWIDYSDEGYVECPFCHSATNWDDNKDELHYCFSCGAELR